MAFLGNPFSRAQPKTVKSLAFLVVLVVFSFLSFL